MMAHHTKVAPDAKQHADGLHAVFFIGFMLINLRDGIKTAD